MNDRNENVKLKENHTQVCVWPGTIVGPDQIEDFEEFVLKEFNTRVQYLEEVKTNPDMNSFNEPISGTGGRNDLLFAVHEDDIMKFAVPRLQAGIRWIEDAVGDWNNENGIIYPERIRKYMSWDDPELTKAMEESDNE